ncbi:unnamed protein product [Acanthoscelides obtectus]|uniref:Uncharacterized protein n=1 Tax=Acanthoscelides obtectus TaxID=200917 RepID=A0A9P0MK35_ACAOB|nr:unnamed protein product [Acanthoscelides obtectus]CAK1666765.1 hypothetical protein AOBTE_LOCUS25474 [Acanthoscelides obtectus]
MLGKRKEGTVLIRGEPSYFSDIKNTSGICKRGKQVSNISPEEIELNKVELNAKKIKDVDQLLRKHFGTDWQKIAVKENIIYYKEVVARFGKVLEEGDSDNEENERAEELSDVQEADTV